MKKFIPYEKLSKKKQRELDALRRNVWTISPVTRKPENSKAYNRKKAQKWNDDSGFCAFCIIYSIFRYNDYRMAKTIVTSIVFATKRHVWQRMI